MTYLSPREVQLLEALRDQPVKGLDKHEAGKAIGIAPHMAEIFMYLLRSQGYVAMTCGRYYIIQKGCDRLTQPQLPGMNL